MDFSWAKTYPDLYSVCTKFNLVEIVKPNRFCYRSLQGLLQEGPQCGLIALSIILGQPNREMVTSLLNEAKRLGYTYNGEMFSARDMYKLAMMYSNRNIILHEGVLDSDNIREFLLSGGLMLVPYPCILLIIFKKIFGETIHILC